VAAKLKAVSRNSTRCSPKDRAPVIPAKAGIHFDVASCRAFAAAGSKIKIKMDSGFRRNDGDLDVPPVAGMTVALTLRLSTQ
jgi:hypothetical protein